MSETKLDVGGDSSVAQKEIDKLVKQVSSLKEQMRQLTDQSKKGAKEAADETRKWADGMKALSEIGRNAYDDRWERGLKVLKEQNAELHRQKEHHSEIRHWLSDQGKELVGLVTGYFTVEKGVEAVVELYDGWREKMKEIGDEHKQLSADILKTVGEAGLLAHAKEATEFLEHGGPGTTKQRQQAFAGVTAGAPNASFEAIQALTNAAAKSAPLGYDLNARGKLLGLLSVAAPGKEAGDLADLASALTQKAGARSEELTSPAFLRNVGALTHAGMSPEQAFAMAVTALNKGEKLNFLSAMGESLDESNRFEGAGNTTEGRLKRRFGRLSSADRYQALMRDRRMRHAVLGDQAHKFEMLPQDQIQQLEEFFAEAQRANLSSTEVENLHRSLVGQEALQSQSGAEAASLMEGQYGPRANIVANLHKLRAARAGDKSRGGSMGRYLFAEFENWANAASDAMSSTDEYARADVDLSQKSGLITQEEARRFYEALDRVAEQLKENTEATRRNTNGRPSANVDAHGEKGAR